MEESKDLSYQRLREHEGNYLCAQCGANLVTIWNNDKALHQLVCSKDHAHRGVKRISSDVEVVKRGELDTIKGPGAQRDIEAFVEANPGAISLAPTMDVATRQPLSPAQFVALESFARTICVFASLGHVCLYFGQPYITIDGYYYLKNRSRLPFTVCCEPMTDEERKAYQVTDGSHAFVARALTTGGGELNRGIGIITPEEMNEKSKKHPENFAAPIVHDKPQRMAEKRAEWQLLKKMVPLGAEFAQPETTPREPLTITPESEKDAELLWP